MLCYGFFIHQSIWSVPLSLLSSTPLQPQSPSSHTSSGAKPTPFPLYNSPSTTLARAAPQEVTQSSACIQFYNLLPSGTPGYPPPPRAIPYHYPHRPTAG